MTFKPFSPKQNRAWVALLLSVSPIAWALGPFQIKDIVVRGADHVGDGSVLSHMSVGIGDTINDEVANEQIKQLFASGLFADIKLTEENGVLIVAVKERSAISTIEIIGNHDIDTETVRAALEHFDLSEGRVLNRDALNQFEQELTNEYTARGYYSVNIQSTITPQKDGRSAVKVDVFEGDRAKIRQITFDGNEQMSRSNLLRAMTLRERGFLNGVLKKDRFSSQVMTGDVESIRSLYLDNGYLDVEIDTPQVTLSDDKKDIFINFEISEGQRYTISSIKYDSESVPEGFSDLSNLIEIQTGEIVSNNKVEQSRQNILSDLANNGYANAIVTAVSDIDEANATVGYTFVVNPGLRVYVRRIEIEGNERTEDLAIRREMRQYEGTWYSAERIQRSETRLNRSGFFSTASIETVPVAGVPDQVDLIVHVEETSTTNFNLALGYSDGDGIVLTGEVTERNLFGQGKNFSFNANTNENTNSYSIDYNNPYYTDSGIKRGFRASVTTYDAAAADVADYLMDTYRAGIYYNIPVTEFNAFFVGLDYERVELEATESTPPEFTEYIEQSPETDAGKLTLNFSRDTLDSFYYPSAGGYQLYQVEGSIPGSEVEYYKATVRQVYYTPLTEDYVFKVGAELGYGSGYGDTDGLPFYRHYFAGGPSSVRGYSARSLGPRDSGESPAPIGANTRLLANAEFLFPFPLAPDQSRRLSLFTDMGQVYEHNSYSFQVDDLRYSAGLAFYWQAPIGPLQLSYAWPLNLEEDDRQQSFQISIGTPFR